MLSTRSPFSLFLRPLNIFKGYSRDNFANDLIAGITVAVVLLPQAIAFALIAELPPIMGLYAAIIGAFFGALWGSSNQIHTGPTNAISLLVLSSLTAVADPNTAEYIIAAGLLAVMVGVFQMAMGFLRMGVLVNFVSHSVVVGFTAGAGVLIILKQTPHLLGIEFESHNILGTIEGIFKHITETNLITFAIGVIAILVLVIGRKIHEKIPTALVAMLVGSLLVYANGEFSWGGEISVIGELDASLPHLVDISNFSIDLISTLSAGALAVGAIGLVETSAISRAIASQTGQRLNNNQEFVGQGMANVFSGLFNGYPTAGSFSRTALNFNANAKSALAALLSAIFVLIAMFALAPAAAYLPRTALAAVLIVTGFRIINTQEIKHIWQGSREDGIIMVVTLVGTLVLHIEFAVLTGILLSFALYVMKTSVPRVVQFIPEGDFKHMISQPSKDPCPQLSILGIEGDLYFGAVNHVEEAILNILAENPNQRYLLLNMSSVVNCDITGIHMMENLMGVMRDRGGDLFISKINDPVMSIMTDSDFYDHLGWDHFLTHDQAISHLFYKVLDPATCIYECKLRVFEECQNLPKKSYGVHLSINIHDTQHDIETISSENLWTLFHENNAPNVIDIREPREFENGHIPNAQLVPLPSILSGEEILPKEDEIILVCRTGRRSRLAANYLLENGYSKLRILNGGIVSWENSGMLEAVEPSRSEK